MRLRKTRSKRANPRVNRRDAAMAASGRRRNRIHYQVLLMCGFRPSEARAALREARARGVRAAAEAFTVTTGKRSGARAARTA